MADNFFKVRKGLNVEPTASPTLNQDGDIAVDSATNKLNVRLNGANDNAVLEAATQTLTNKTLTTPVISSISNSGTITVPSGTDTLVARNTTDTLTNKTLSSPTINTPTVDVATLDGQASTPSNPSAGFYKLYVDDTTSKLQLLDSSGTVATVGSGAGGGINYIENPDAEAATTGWATYADAAGSSPVDGTGGSPNITWTRSTSSPLRGLASFLLTKGAADRQGEGASYDFTIDEADKAKVMQIGFDYAVASGTYATGDVAIYVVDVTNSVVIQPSAYQVENVGVNSTARLTFQTASNSTSYRLCFHVASTSSSAYSLKFDNIQLGPQVVPLGAPMTDWVSYTPTISNLGTGSASSFGKWRRNGDTLEVTYNWTKDGSNGSGSFTVQVGIPSGLTIDVDKLPNGASISSGESYSSLTTDLVSMVNQSGGFSVKRTAATALVGSDVTASSNYRGSFSVPIVGWSSSTVVSSSADTRVVAMRAYRATNQTGVGPNNSFVKLTYDTADFDTAGCFDSANSRFTVRVPGQYRIAATAYIAGTNTLNNSYGLVIYKNGSLVSYGEVSTNATATAGFSRSATTNLRLVAGDYIEIYLYGQGNNSVSTLTMTGGITVSSFSVDLIQGPSQIAASEIVSMVCYKNTGSHTSNGNLQDVTSWNAVTKDSHGGFNTTTGVYTIPAPGDYIVTFTLAFGSTSGTRQGVVLKGSTVVAYGPVAPPGDPSTCPPITIMVPNCVAGDTLKVQAFQNSGGNLAYATAANVMYLQVHRLGGV